jgi:hypothetical protein
MVDLFGTIWVKLHQSPRLPDLPEKELAERGLVVWKTLLKGKRGESFAKKWRPAIQSNLFFVFLLTSTRVPHFCIAV